MKLMVFGSANIDHVYQLPHFVRAGETLASISYARNAGGKGFNQALALAKAGQEVWFAGAIGQDGLFLKDMLLSLGVHVDDLLILDSPTGHAIIQVDAAGSNSIILHGGANHCITSEMIDQTLMQFHDSCIIQQKSELGFPCSLFFSCDSFDICATAPGLLHYRIPVASGTVP